MKKILYVIGSLEVGGAEKHLLSIALSMKRLGYRIELFVLEPGGPLAVNYAEASIPIFSPVSGDHIKKITKNKKVLAYYRAVLAFLCLVKTFYVRRPDIAHFFLPTAYIIGGAASLFYPLSKRIMSRRSLNFYQEKSSYVACIERFLHRKMNYICANSKAVLNDLKGEGVTEDKLKLIYNGIDVESFLKIRRPLTRLELDIGKDDVVFVITANLIPYKGHRDLIEAFALIKGKMNRQNWKLIFIGRDDGIGENLKKRAEQCGIRKNLVFLGGHKEVSSILNIADVGILSSHEEGFSNAILEYMASSLPVVVTNVGGNSEAVINNKTGFVVDAHSPEQLAEKLLEIYNIENRREIGKSAYSRVKKYFSKKECVSSYLELYT